MVIEIVEFLQNLAFLLHKISGQLQIRDSSDAAALATSHDNDTAVCIYSTFCTRRKRVFCCNILNRMSTDIYAFQKREIDLRLLSDTVTMMNDVSVRFAGARKQVLT